MTRKLVTILAGLALLVALAPAIGLADSISGSTGGWQGTSGWTPSNNGFAYWANQSSDGTTQNIGYCMAESCGGPGISASGNVFTGPGDLPYWANSNGSADSDITFTADSISNGAALEVELAGNAGYNNFGYCDTSGCHVIFTGPQGAGATATFTPVGTYTFFFTDTAVGNGAGPTGTGLTGDTWYTNASLNNQGVGNQHFAVFEGSSAGTYWLGMEDLPFCSTGTTCSLGSGSSTSDRDYNDMVVEVTNVPEPGTLTLLGTGLIGLAGFIRRRRAA